MLFSQRTLFLQYLIWIRWIITINKCFLNACHSSLSLTFIGLSYLDGKQKAEHIQNFAVQLENEIYLQKYNDLVHWVWKKLWSSSNSLVSLNGMCFLLMMLVSSLTYIYLQMYKVSGNKNVLQYISVLQVRENLNTFFITSLRLLLKEHIGVQTTLQFQKIYSLCIANLIFLSKSIFRSWRMNVRKLKLIIELLIHPEIDP